jgi:adenylosuccinate synthase
MMRDGKEHVFSNFGSGSLLGAPTYWMEQCTVDPVGIKNEFEVLQSKRITPTLYIHKECPVTTPWDKLRNQDFEKIKAQGSCGVGFGNTIQREEDFYSLKVVDLLYPKIFDEKVRLLEKYYHYHFSAIVYDLKDLSIFQGGCNFIKDNDNIKFVDDNLLNNFPNSTVIYEGSQGLLLDQHFGFFPHVTRSNTGTRNIIGDSPYVYLVTRAYQTRHGNGFMTNENIPFVIKEDPNEKNVDHPYQGKFRKTMLDLDLLRYGIERDGYINKNNTTLVITCLDHLNEYSFTFEGYPITCPEEKSFIKQIKNILGFENVLVSHNPYSELEVFEK